MQAALIFQRYSPATTAMGEITVDQTLGTCGICNVQAVTITANPLQLGDCSTSLGYIFVKNLDATNYLELSLDNFTKIFSKLKPGQFCLVPAPAGLAAVYAKATGGTVMVMVCAAQL